MNKFKEKSLKASFGGVSTALSVIIMAFFGSFSSLVYAAPLVCGVFITVAFIEFKTGYALNLYFAVSLLSIFIVPNKEAALMYALFFGVYPILKGKAEGWIKNNALLWTVKYLYFNAAVITCYLICSKLLNIPYEEIGAFGKFSIIFLWASGNIAFFIYDIAFTRIISVYILKWQKYIKRLFR